MAEETLYIEGWETRPAGEEGRIALIPRHTATMVINLEKLRR